MTDITRHWDILLRLFHYRHCFLFAYISSSSVSRRFSSEHADMLRRCLPRHAEVADKDAERQRYFAFSSCRHFAMPDAAAPCHATRHQCFPSSFDAAPPPPPHAAAAAAAADTPIRQLRRFSIRWYFAAEFSLIFRLPPRRQADAARRFAEVHCAAFIDFRHADFSSLFSSHYARLITPPPQAAVSFKDEGRRSRRRAPTFSAAASASDTDSLR